VKVKVSAVLAMVVVMSLLSIWMLVLEKSRCGSSVDGRQRLYYSTVR